MSTRNPWKAMTETDWAAAYAQYTDADLPVNALRYDNLEEFEQDVPQEARKVAFACGCSDCTAYDQVYINNDSISIDAQHEEWKNYHYRLSPGCVGRLSVEKL